MTGPQYDFICSIGELIDKLSIENIKCYHANEAILAERRKSSPNAQVIADMELKARTSGELRVKLKCEINARINDAIQRGGIGSAAEARTYDLRGI